VALVKRAVGVFAVGATLLGGVLSATAAAQEAAAPTPPSGTLTFTERDGYFKFHDTGRKGPTIGDTFVISSDLLSGANRIGTLRAWCVVTSRKGMATECIGTFFLPDGQINGQVGMKGDSLSTDISIVGGTGRYAGARGVVTSKSRGPNSKFSDDTVTFIG
jgi:hypothetical protein